MEDTGAEVAARRCYQLRSERRSQVSVSALGPLKTREHPEFPSEACLSWPLTPGAVTGARAREDGVAGLGEQGGRGGWGGRTEKTGRLGRTRRTGWRDWVAREDGAGRGRMGRTRGWRNWVAGENEAAMEEGGVWCACGLVASVCA